MKRVMLVFGTRPEAIKMAPVVRSSQQSPTHEPIVVVTAQHREMLDQVLDLFDITPAPRPGPDHAAAGPGGAHQPRAREPGAAAWSRSGRTSSSCRATRRRRWSGALAAFYAGVPVGHLEAGLRTGDPTNPFPEEMNRRLTTRLSSLHLAATPLAAGNLLREGVARRDVVVTGNTVIDALLWAVEQDRPVTDPLLERGRGAPGPVVLVTTHRRESWGAPMHRVGLAVAELARRFPAALFVLPMHRNPAVREVLLPALADVPNVVTGEPSDYWTFARLMRRATLLLSDSGGVQEEGPASASRCSSCGTTPNARRQSPPAPPGWSAPRPSGSSPRWRRCSPTHPPTPRWRTRSTPTATAARPAAPSWRLTGSWTVRARLTSSIPWEIRRWTTRSGASPRCTDQGRWSRSCDDTI